MESEDGVEMTAFVDEPLTTRTEASGSVVRDVTARPNLFQDEDDLVRAVKNEAASLKVQEAATEKPEEAEASLAVAAELPDKASDPSVPISPSESASAELASLPAQAVSAKVDAEASGKGVEDPPPAQASAASGAEGERDREFCIRTDDCTSAAIARTCGGKSSFGPFTVVLFGNSGVGKTTMLLRYVVGQETALPTQRQATVAADISRMTVRFPDLEASATLNLWDTAGAERYRTFISKYMRILDAAVIVCSLDSVDSIKSIVSWHQEISKSAPQCAIWYVVANKTDVSDRAGDSASGEMISRAIELSRICNIPNFICTSAVTGEGIVRLFQNIARFLINRELGLAQMCMRSIGQNNSDARMKLATDSVQVITPRTMEAYRASCSGLVVVKARPRVKKARKQAQLPKSVPRRKDDVEVALEDMPDEEIVRILRRAAARERGMYSFCTIS
jgi:small GTP-binding protein